MNKESKIRALRARLGRESYTKGDELIFHCPRQSCSDRQKQGKAPKLSVNIKTNSIHCWICEFKGSNLLPVLKSIKDDDYIEYLSEIKSQDKIIEPTRKYDHVTLPKGFKPLSNNQNHSRSLYRDAALAYLNSRGISQDDIERYKLGYTEEGEYQRKIIFPSFDSKGVLNFVVGRSIYENDGPKYKHGEYDKDIIFNEYLIDWKSPVTLVEGPFDMIKSGPNSIPLQGSFLNANSKLFFKLFEEDVDVTICLDRDAIKKQFNIVELFIKYGIMSPRFVVLDKKDPGSMTKDEFLNVVNRGIRINSPFDIQKLRIATGKVRLLADSTRF